MRDPRPGAVTNSALVCGHGGSLLPAKVAWLLRPDPATAATIDVAAFIHDGMPDVEVWMSDALTITITITLTPILTHRHAHTHHHTHHHP